MNTRDATVAALSDAQYIAPLVQSGDLLSGGPRPSPSDEDIQPRRPTKTFFYVFEYQTKDGFYSQVDTYYNINYTSGFLCQEIRAKAFFRILIFFLCSA